MYTSRRGRSGPRWLMGFILGLFLSSSILIFLALNTDAVNHRIEAIPYYLRTFANKYRPNVAMPTPPAISAVAPETLLRTSTNNDTPAQPNNDTPAYFNEESLDPSETTNDDADTVALVQSNMLSVAPIAPQVTLPVSPTSGKLGTTVVL